MFRPNRWIPILVALTAACGGDDASNDRSGGGSGSGGNGSGGGSGSGGNGSGGGSGATERALELTFEARAGQDPIVCTETATAGTSGPLSIRDFRLYLSNPRLVDERGQEWPIVLEEDGTWQSGEVVLLDFEDGTGSCSASGNSSLRTTARGQTGLTDDASLASLRFELGIPRARNHLDVSGQPSPLNVLAMFWNWRGGYKFIRIDVRDEGPNPGSFNFHLGSTGCTSTSPLSPPTEACARPNLPTVTLEGYDADDTIVFDLAGLLQGVDTSFNTGGTAPGCMSSPTEDADCDPVFENLGLAFDTGTCIDNCSNQRFVRLD